VLEQRVNYLKLVQSEREFSLRRISTFVVPNPAKAGEDACAKRSQVRGSLPIIWARVKHDSRSDLCKIGQGLCVTQP